MREDDRLVGREQRVEIAVGEPVRMFLMRLQGHQIDNIDDPDLELRQMLPKEGHCRQSFQSRHIAGAGHHNIGLAALIVARPFPNPDAGGAVVYPIVEAPPLRLRLLSRDDDVDAIPAAKAMVGYMQQRSEEHTSELQS